MDGSEDMPQVNCEECDVDITYSSKIVAGADSDIYFCSVVCRDDWMEPLYG